MIESFEYAGVVDGRSVEQDAEEDEGEKRPNELSILFCFNRLYHVGETEKSS